MSEKESKSVGFLRFAHILWWVFKIFIKITPVETVTYIITTIIIHLRGLIWGYIFGITIDAIITQVTEGNNDIKNIFPYLALIGAHQLLLGRLISSLRYYVAQRIGNISGVELERMLNKKIQELGIQTLEDPEVVNLIQRSNEWMGNMFPVVKEFTSFIANLVALTVSATAIFFFFPILIPIIILTSVIAYYPNRYFIKKEFKWYTENTEEKRRARSSSNYLSNPNLLHEVNIVGGFQYLDKKYNEFYSWYNEGIFKIARNWEIASFATGILNTFAILLGYVYVFFTLINGRITVGSVLFHIRTIELFSDAGETLLLSITSLNQMSVKLDELVTLFEMEPTSKDGEIEIPRLKEPPTIIFKNVSFKYPRTEKLVLKNLNLEIKAGEKLAIVGHNGAGKTTLIRLLARIYTATKGEILINGINIKDLKLDDWYKNIGVLFQDFNLYSHLNVEENIHLGRPAKELDQERMKEAIRSADAEEFVLQFTDQYKQVLSEKYKGGIRPSSGQAQKIAIARFFYRNASVAVFDEPTAAIDAVSEYNIFNSIYKFFKDKSVIIISHRFSTVRNADKIIVLDNGSIIESGNHDELINLNGKYCEAYKLQAEGYK